MDTKEVKEENIVDEKVEKKDKLNKFSVPLGLLDYINPILYTITMVTLIRNIYSDINMPYNILLLIGAIVSIVFGLVIPTGKVIVGLGIIEFRMPVSLVFTVNSGIFLTGLILIKTMFEISLPIFLAIIVLLVLLLLLLYKKSKKINTIAVLTGAFGYLMIYTFLIILSIAKVYILPIIFLAIAILLFLMLCMVGIKANLKNPKVHWLIEISNVTCQLLVAISTIILVQ